MDILEIQFRKREQRWQVRVVPRSAGMSPHEWQDWSPPREEHLERELLASLFNADEARRLLDKPWHLQLRGEKLGLSSPGIPPGVDWAYLVHPKSGCHILEVGWTATELVVDAAPAMISGQVVVLGDKELAATLRHTATPLVSEATIDTVPKDAIVVVGGKGMDDETARKLDARIWPHCPLLVWYGFTPPRGAVPAIFDNGWPPPDGYTEWLARLLGLLVRGHQPVVAFREAGASEPPENRFRRRMRGAHDEWRIMGKIPEFTLPWDWYILLDRSEQESHLNTLVDGLDRSRSRRIQVVFVPGADGSGLRYFRRRPLRYNGTRTIVEWELGWADNPAHTIQELQRKVHASRPVNLVHRLQEESARHESGALFVVRHSPVSLEPERGAIERERDAMRVTLAELKQYCSDLQKLATDLGTEDLRLLVHISVVGATTDSLCNLRNANHPHFMADVLKTLNAGVPRSELELWLRAHDLRFDESALDQTRGMNYDELVQWILQRQPGLVEA